MYFFPLYFCWFIFPRLLALIYSDAFHFQTIDTFWFFWFVDQNCFTLCFARSVCGLQLWRWKFHIRYLFIEEEKKRSFQALQRESYSINVVSHHFMPKYFVASSKQMSMKHENDDDGSFDKINVPHGKRNGMCEIFSDKNRKMTNQICIFCCGCDIFPLIMRSWAGIGNRINCNYRW